MKPASETIESLYQTVIEATGDGIMGVDVNSGTVLHANKWAARITGLEAGDRLPFAAPGRHQGIDWLSQTVAQASAKKITRACMVRSPARRGGRRTKLLEVVSRRFDHEDPFVVIVIRQISSGKEIERKLWQRNHELHMLNRAGHKVGRSLNPDEVLKQALDFSLDLFSGRAGVAYLADPQARQLVEVAARGFSKLRRPASLSLDEPTRESRAFLAGEPVICGEGWEPGARRAPLAPCACTISIPVRTSETVHGLLEVGMGEQGAVGEFDDSLPAAFGYQVGAALNNALLHKQVELASRRDGLTGAFNRHRLEELLEDRIKRGRRYNERFAALMVDLDHFKWVNDVHGHGVGDQVLRQVVDLLRGEIRETDHLGRWGGEEFLLLLSETDCQAALEACERIRTRVAATLFAHGTEVELPVTICIGAACYPEHADTAEALVRCADDAMRCAKRAGRNRTQLYGDQMCLGDFSVSPHRFELGYGSETIKALAAALDAKDSYTASHSQAVELLAGQLAGQMNIDARRIETLQMAALLHDIGKVAVPDSVLNKPGPLDENEWAIIREHPRMGVLILKEAPQLASIIPVVLHHHENFDGSGYPEGRAGEDIPLLSRILCVADGFMAMTSSRPYRQALSREAAYESIQSGRGKIYDPRVVDALDRVMQAAN